MFFQGGAPFLPHLWGPPSPSGMKFLSQNTRDSKLSFAENSKFLSHLVLDCDVTDTKTDRITIANKNMFYRSYM